MIKTLLTAVVLAVTFAIASPLGAARIWVQVAPPAPIVETVPAQPGAGYVWVGGYYRWDGARYVWVHGHYVAHGGAWVPGHWEHVTGSGWYWVPGHWR
jgi:hypothetical protein